MDLTKLVMEPIFGAVSDEVGRKKLLIAREVILVVVGIIFLLARSWHFLFLGSILIGLSMSLISVWNAMVAESAEPDHIASLYAIVGTCYMGAGLLGTLGAGIIAERLGYDWVYVIVTILGVASLLAMHLWLPETREYASSGFDYNKVRKAFAGVLSPPKYLRGFYLAMGLDLLAFSMGMRIINGMLVKGFGYTPYQIGLIMASMTLTMALAQIPFGRLADRIGYSRFMVASQLMASVMLGMVIISKSFEFVLIAHLILGIANALWMPAEQAWIATNVDPADRAKSLGSFSTFRGLWGLPAPLIGGILFDSFGFDIPIFGNLILALIDAILIFMLVKDKSTKLK
jgi:DHA1 family tetracycline resistance protein-like MFS transporter